MGIKGKSVDRSSNLNRYRIPIGTEHATLQSATAAATEILVPIHDNSRLVEYLLGARGTGSTDTGDLDVGLYLGATATAGALLTSATARLDSGSTGTLITQSLNTAIIRGPNGGMIISAGSVLLFDVNQNSASHSVGNVMASIMLELDEE